MYLQEDQYYLISNYAVARNPLFCDLGIQKHFKTKMKYYLDPICDILAYKLKDQEFQILVKLKERVDFERFHEEKYSDLQGLVEIPESTYIFSQAMSNLQVSLVKKFNFRYNRKGTLMAGRFIRRHLSTEGEIIRIIHELNGDLEKNNHSGIWADCAMERIAGMTSKSNYKKLEIKHKGGESGFWKEFQSDLVGQIKSNDMATIIHPPKYHQRLYFKSLCRYFE